MCYAVLYSAVLNQDVHRIVDSVRVIFALGFSQHLIKETDGHRRREQRGLKSSANRRAVSICSERTRDCSYFHHGHSVRMNVTLSSAQPLVEPSGDEIGGQLGDEEIRRKPLPTKGPPFVWPMA